MSKVYHCGEEVSKHSFIGTCLCTLIAEKYKDIVKESNTDIDVFITLNGVEVDPDSLFKLFEDNLNYMAADKAKEMIDNKSEEFSKKVDELVRVFDSFTRDTVHKVVPPEYTDPNYYR